MANVVVVGAQWGDGKIEKLGPAKFRIAAKIGYHIEEETSP